MKDANSVCMTSVPSPSLTVLSHGAVTPRARLSSPQVALSAPRIPAPSPAIGEARQNGPSRWPSWSRMRPDRASASMVPAGARPSSSAGRSGKRHDHGAVAASRLFRRRAA